MGKCGMCVGLRRDNIINTEEVKEAKYLFIGKHNEDGEVELHLCKDHAGDVMDDEAYKMEHLLPV